MSVPSLELRNYSPSRSSLTLEEWEDSGPSNSLRTEGLEGDTDLTVETSQLRQLHETPPEMKQVSLEREVFNPLTATAVTAPENHHDLFSPLDLPRDSCHTQASLGKEVSSNLLPATAVSAPGNSNDLPSRLEDQDNQPWKHWKLACFFIIIITLSISLPVGWTLREKDITVSTPKHSVTIQLYGNLVSIDPAAQVMILDWQIHANCGADYNVSCTDDDIFFDQNLLQNSAGKGGPPSNNIPTPTFRINGSILNDQDLSLFSNSLFFRTQVITYSNVDLGFKERTLQAYPFDTYAARIHIFAKNSSIAVTHVNGIAPGFSVRINPDASTNGDNSIVLLSLNISRGNVVKLYSITIIVAIWLVTLTLLSVSVTFVIFGRTIAKEILAIPVATLFAFTSLRGTLPGAPKDLVSGAAIDFMGILPCLAILTFCAVLMLGVYVLRRNPEESHFPIWKTFSNKLDIKTLFPPRHRHGHDGSSYT